MNIAANMLGLAKRVKAKILQASTSEVYGDPQVHPQVESYWGHVNPIGLRSCYVDRSRIRLCANRGNRSVVGNCSQEYCATAGIGGKVATRRAYCCHGR